MILGINLDENYIHVSIDGKEDVDTYLFSLGRNIDNKTWFVGRPTLDEGASDKEIVIDKLYYVLENDGVVRVGDEEYKATDLAKIFFANLLVKYDFIEYITVVVRDFRIAIIDKIRKAIEEYVDDAKKCKVSSYSEAFAAFINSKEKDYYANTVALFDFTEKALTYYELVRYFDNEDREYWNVVVDKNWTLPIDLLSENAGKKICDDLLYGFSLKCTKDKMYSNIIISGNGFKSAENYREFMTYICRLAPVETNVNFLAKAALIMAKYSISEYANNYKYLFTDARTIASIKLIASKNNELEKVNLVSEGVEWFYVNDSLFDVILDGRSDREIVLEVYKILSGQVKPIHIVIPENYILRKDKTNCFEVKLNFIQQNLLGVSIEDKGFGEFFEPKYKILTMKKEI